MDTGVLHTMASMIRFHAVHVYDAARDGDWKTYAEELASLEMFLERAKKEVDR